MIPTNNFLYRHSKYLRYRLALSLIILVTLGVATSVRGGCIAVDQVSSDTVSNPNSSLTISHTVSGTNRFMLVGVSITNDTPASDYVSSVTWNGTESFTQVGHVEQVDDARVEIWQLVGPSTGTHNLVVNFNALSVAAIVGVVSFTGVDQNNPLRTSPAIFASSHQDNTALATLDIPSDVGEVVFGVVSVEDRTVSASSGQTEQWNYSIGGDRTTGAGGIDTGASSSVTMSWDLTGTDHWAMGGVSLNPASGKNLVMVVGNTTLPADDQTKRNLFESWGWTVSLLDDDTADFSSAAASNDVMFISESVSGSTTNTKARDLNIGIVVEEDYVWDEMGFGTPGDGGVDHDTITITDNSHYITSPFSLGNLTVYSVGYDRMGSLGSPSPTLASGGQSLASENAGSSPTLFAFNTGANLVSGTAANRRVGFPTKTSDPTYWTANLKTLLQRSLEWAAGCGAAGVVSSCGTNLVMVVGTDFPSSSYDSAKQTLFESWGWTVSAINDTDSQTIFNNAAANNDVMYISESSTSSNVSTKARDLDIGTVDDECWLWDSMEYGSIGDGGGDWGTTINITDNSHYITSPFSTGALTVYSTGGNLNNLPSSLASGGQLLGQTPNGGDPTLFAFDTGATLDSGTAANRRVGFPSFDTAPSLWTADLKILLQRSLEWAAGCGAGGGSTNSYPVLASIGNQSIDEGQLLEFTISATDPDTGDTLTYSASNLPTGASFDPDTQTFSWTPTSGDAGTYSNVLFTVQDDGTPQGSDSEGITITVNAVGGGVGTVIDASYVADYSCNMKITIDHTKVAFTSPQNFPVLIHITDDSLMTSGCGFMTDPDGDDLVFTNSAITLRLDHEVEKYDGTTGELVAWVLVPSLSGSTDMDILMYYGNSNVTTFQTDSKAVWDTNYVGIWHLHDTVEDSTSYNNDGIGHNTDNDGGKIADGEDFDGSGDWIEIPHSASLNIAGNYTIELWVNYDTWEDWDYLIGKGDDWNSDVPAAVQFWDVSNRWGTDYTDDSTNWCGGSANSTLSAGNWYHISVTYNASTNTLNFYRNGQPDGSDSGCNATTNTMAWGIGADGLGHREIDGDLDEVRISNTLRSPEWILTSYNNQNSPSTFFGYEKNCPGTVPPIAAFTCSIPLVIDSSKVSGTSDLINFPVLITLTNTSLKTTGSCGYVQSSDGYDIIFSDSTQTTVLDHEIEKYDGVSGELVAWVRVPILSATSDTTIYLHFGHSSVCGATENPTGVWDANYKGVWHLNESVSNESSGATHYDSTSNNNDGTQYGNDEEPGKIADGQDFDGIDDYVDVGGGASLKPTSAFTISAWYNGVATNQRAVVYSNGFSWGSDIGIRVSGFQDPTDKRARVLVGQGTSFSTTQSDSVIPENTWTHLVTTFDGTTVRLYIDGTKQVDEDTSSVSYNSNSAAIGANLDASNQNFDGYIDEVRVSNTARSADWIQTEYNNQSDPASFYSVGASSCFLSGFSCNRRITIDSSKVEGSSDLTNFPFLVNIQNDCNLKTVANGGGVQNSSGWDIIFVDSDGVTQLDHEIEDYDGDAGDLVAWVRIPTLPYNSDKDIYMYYGKSGLTCDPSNPTGVWDSSYEAVYHLNEETDFQDSTSHNRDATAEDTNGGSGIIANGEDFGPQDEIAIGNWSFSGDKLTLQAWARFDDFDQDDPRVFSKANGTSEQNHVFMLGLGGNLEQHLRMRVKTGTDDYSGTTTIVDTDDPLSAGNWYLIAGTYDGANMRLLSNGVEIHSAAKTGNLRVNSWNIALGNHPGNTDPGYTSMDGKLDEVRILSVARSADWLKTEYNNQSDPDSFYSLSQDTCGGTYGFNYQYCKKITVDHTQVAQASLQNFPLLVNIQNNSDLKTEANGGRVMSDQGYDIVFKTSGCLTLDHEIDYYDGTTGTLVAWVRIPDLTNTEDYEIYMYYGANVICSPENPDGLWDPSTYEAVYHLSDDYKDSTSHDRDGTNYGTSFTASQIGRGALFTPGNGWDHIELGNWNVDDNDLVIQAWAWPNDFNQGDPRIVSKCADWGSSSQQHVFMLSLYNGTSGENRMRFRVKTGTDNAAGTVELQGSDGTGCLPSAQEWYFLTGSYFDSGNQMKLWRDTSGDTTAWQDGWLRQNSWPVWIGANPYGSSNSNYSWDGILDEIRIISQARSAGWITTEYRNQSDPGNFYSISSCFEQTSEVTQEWFEEVQ